MMASEQSTKPFYQLQRKSDFRQSQRVVAITRKSRNVGLALGELRRQTNKLENVLKTIDHYGISANETLRNVRDTIARFETIAAKQLQDWNKEIVELRHE